MKKKILSDSVGVVTSSYSAPLFGSPVSIARKPSRKTHLLVRVSDDAGGNVLTDICVEDFNAKVEPLDYSEVTLSNLVSKGVDVHALDIIDSSKLGVDAGVSDLAHQILTDTKYSSILKNEPNS